MLLIFYFPVLSCANTILLKLELHAEEALFLFIYFFFLLRSSSGSKWNL